MNDFICDATRHLRIDAAMDGTNTAEHALERYLEHVAGETVVMKWTVEEILAREG